MFKGVNNIELYLIPNAISGDEKRQTNDRITPLYDNMRTEKNVKCIEYFRDKYNIWKNTNDDVNV